MTIEAKIILDSISPEGDRLTTFQLRYPRFIHAEFMTHRMFSRNASSSRAIPVERMIADLRRDPAMPVFWGSNKPGMQAGAEVDPITKDCLEHDWLNARDEMIFFAEEMIKSGLHKQIANRILEPWAHINVVCTATDYKQFYELRRHPDAQPEIKALADAMYEAQEASTPTLLQPGQWHLPYITDEDREDMAELNNWGNPHAADKATDDNLIRVSVARCGRVSYLTHDGRKTTIEEDLMLALKLLGSAPLHASPAEHQATPDTHKIGDDMVEGSGLEYWDNQREHANFTGWRMHRKMLPGEFTPG